jgi:hypothetical protein
MSEGDFEEKVRHHLWLYTEPDYSAKEDAVNFFRVFHQQAMPILARLADRGDRVAGEMLTVARAATDE